MLNFGLFIANSSDHRLGHLNSLQTFILILNNYVAVLL